MSDTPTPADPTPDPGDTRPDTGEPTSPDANAAAPVDNSTPPRTETNPAADTSEPAAVTGEPVGAVISGSGTPSVHSMWARSGSPDTPVPPTPGATAGPGEYIPPPGSPIGAVWTALELGQTPHMRPIPSVQPPRRSAVVPMPRGTFTAIAGAGVAAAVCVPLDRPGIGWLLAALASGGAVYAVDRRARRAAEAGDSHVVASQVPDATSGADAASMEPPSVMANSSGGVATDTAPHDAATGSVKPGASPENSAVAQDDSAPDGIWSRVPGIAGWSAERVLVSARIWWAVLAVALVAVGTVRAAGWLFVLCLIGAAMVASLAVVGRRSAHGVLFDVLAVPFGAVTSLPWLYRWAGRREAARRENSRRVGGSVLVTLGLLVVFVPLLAGADAVFARLVSGLIPALDPAEVWSWGFLFVAAGLGVAGALYTLAGPPLVARAGVREEPGSEITGVFGIRRFSRAEWGLPLGALTVVFAVFVATQLAVLFGGDGYVQRTADLTYAEYARSGFWQLSIVSLLTLVVIAIVQRHAAQRTASERLWLRVVVAAVSVLTMVIVASALHRMWTYQQAYGFTVLRVVVEVFELWIALIYVLVLASLVRLSREWLPRAAIGSAALTLLALAVLNPERFIADRNIDRWESSHRLDSAYLSGLSADALPAVDRLPADQRDRIANTIRAGIDRDSWREWNLSRARAR